MNGWWINDGNAITMDAMEMTLYHIQTYSQVYDG